MSNLTRHAVEELQRLGEEPEVVADYLTVVKVIDKIFDKHSGASAEFFIQTLNRLLRMQNLTEITNSPDEWFDHGTEMGTEPGVRLFQNKRNGEAFSVDGGKTYWLLSEGGHINNREPLHTAKEYDAEKIPPATGRG